MKSFTFVVLALLPFSSALPFGLFHRGGIASRATIEETTDTLLFSTPIAQFEAARNAQNPSTLDWSSDGCSSSPDDPFGFDFLSSCHRHDFGYRNYKKQNRFTAPNKARIDTNFKTDMYNQCNTESNIFTRAACKAVADIYYEAVKTFGSKKRAAEALAARQMEENVAKA
uniref:p15 n=1 Tax=Helicosporium sp. HN1 TaxID=171189 RepID=Q96TU1_9PEZI|nr:p15 [Helicosporium sp. HN1]